jgi:hypothetical protein
VIVLTAALAVPWIKTVSRRPPTAEALVRARVSPCGVCGGQSGTGTGFFPSSSVSLVIIIPPGVNTRIMWEEEQYVRWWPQFRDIVSPHRIKELLQYCSYTLVLSSKDMYQL